MPSAAEPFTPAWFEEMFAASPGKDQAALFHHLRQQVGPHVGRDKVNKTLRGRRNVQPEEMVPIWEFFGLNTAELAAALVPRSRRREGPPTRIFDERAIKLPPPGAEPRAPDVHGNRDVPEKGVAVGGEDADFRFNGQTIDYVTRPPGIANRKDVFVVRAVNDSMMPAIRPHDPQFVDPHRVPNIGDDVVIETFPDEEGEAGRAFIKRLVRRSGTKITVEQFNPPKQITFDRSEVKHLYRVIPIAELLG